MYVRSMCMYVVFCNIDHCIHIHWCIPMGLGHNDPWVESHMWPQQTWGQRSSRGQWPLVKVLEKRVSVSTYFDVFSNLILQWLQKYVIAKAGETCGSRTALFCENGWLSLNDPLFFLSICQSEPVIFQFQQQIGYFKWIILFKVRYSILCASTGLKRLSQKDKKFHCHPMCQ